MEESVISSDPEVMGGGTPVFAGTRVPVETLLDYLEVGDSIDEFLEGVPIGPPRAGDRVSRAGRGTIWRDQLVNDIIDECLDSGDRWNAAEGQGSR